MAVRKIPGVAPTLKGPPTEILDAEWIRGNDNTLIRYCDAKKKIRICDAGQHPYFFIKTADLEQAERFFGNWVVGVEEGQFITITGHRAVKLNVRYPSDVHSKRYGGLRQVLEKNDIETFESDIPFIRRWMIDQGIMQCPLIDKGYFDIECDARTGFPEPDKAPFRVISISLVGNDGFTKFFCDYDEPAMLKAFFSTIKSRYHMLTGWNIKKFDWPYLLNRMRNLNIRKGFVPIQEIDAMENYKKLTLWGFIGKTYTLEAVSKAYLGVDHESVKNKMQMHELWDSFVGDRTVLKEYNMLDSELVLRLDEKLHLCDPYIELTKLWPILLRDTPFMTTVFDIIFLEEASKHPWRFIFPRRKPHEAALLGGLTLTPVPGVHSSVLSLDFKSLYPTIIITMGLSPELMYLFQAWRATGKPLNMWIKELFGIDCDDDTHPPPVPLEIPMEYEKKATLKYDHWKTYFRDQVPHYIHFMQVMIDLKISPYPFMAHQLDHLLLLRAEIKNEMKKYPEQSLEFMSHNISQGAVKLVLVSSYGVTGYRTTRFFNAEFVNATTGMGQTILEMVVDIADNMGFDVIYGDTDSIFIKAKDGTPAFKLTLEAFKLAKAINIELQEALVAAYGLSDENYRIIVDPKNVYSDIHFSKSKKKYLGNTVWVEGVYEQKREVVGMEAKRSDAFGLMAEVQESLVDILFSSELDVVDDDVEAYLIGIAKLLFSGDVDEKLVLQMSVRKSSLDAYEHDDPHVRVAKKLSARNLFRPGDKVKWIVVADGVEEPIVDGEPIAKPGKRGYLYYWNRLMAMVERMLGEKPDIRVTDEGGVMKQKALEHYV